MTFKDLGLSEKTIQAIEELGISQPTTVQKDVIPSILEGKDIFTIAPGRCGKTCSYVFPLIDIISQRQGQNILIITSDSAQSVVVSDRLAVFNKYHEINGQTVKENKQQIDREANVIIAAPDLLLEIAAEGKIDLGGINILVVDDINLLKKKHQLANLEKVLEMLPAEKQNIVFTNRRSKETQDILDKILKAPAEIKVDRAKEDETAVAPEAAAAPEVAAVPETAVQAAPARGGRKKQPAAPKHENSRPHALEPDAEAAELAARFKTFGDKTPAFLLVKGEIARSED